ncbi:FtsX-like permease family protein, partial [bacterium]
SILEQAQFEIGEKVKVTEMSGSIFPGVIVGQYSGGRVVTVNHVKTKVIGSESILIPLSVVEAMERSKTAFTVAHFVLDPAKNRDLSQVNAELEKVIKAPGAGTKDLRFMVWDEQLRIVVSQLEKNLSILKVLYPVVMAVSVLIAAGLCFLLLLQKSREAAILRVLGTTRTAVRLALIVESFCLSLIGVVIGLGLAALLWMSAGLMPVGALLTSAGLYLGGAIAGLVSGAILVTNKQPLELLQVKE